MLSNTGSIYLLPNSDRKVISAGSFTLGDLQYMLVYPLSSAVYLAGAEDFIFLSSKDSVTPLMAETWNPLLLDNEVNSELILLDNISNYFISKYTEFIYSRLLAVKFSNNKVFTGPPLNANAPQDIRFLFRAQERQVFQKYISINTDPATIGKKENDNSN